MTGAAVIEGKRLEDGQPIRIRFSDGTIDGIEELSDPAGRSSLPWVGPGLVDLQINGVLGIDFNTLPLTAPEVSHAAKQLLERGVTAFLPTVITNSPEAIQELVGILAAACRSDPIAADCIAGIHLEGPFLSPEDGARGAHDRRYIQPPDWELFQRWQEAAEGRIRIITISPEWDNAPEFIARCTASGVIVSIGHTAATSEQIRSAIAAGAKMSTHLGNGAHLMQHRHRNYIWEQLAADELAAGVIADGFHLPESVLKVFLRAKGDNLFLVSDAVYLSGLEPGTYQTHIGGEVVLTKEGKLHLASNADLLAGSVQLLPEGIAHLVRRNLASLPEAWQLASLRPAHFLGLEGAGRLEIGAKADLVLFTQEANGAIRIQEVYKSGRPVISSKPI